MTAKILLGAALALAACDLAPLTRDQLFGAPDAAGQPDAGAATEVGTDGEAGSDPACVPRSQDGLFSGAAADDCDGSPVNASIGIGGQHACTFAAKGSFQFRGLPVGCRLTVTASAPGYASHQATVVIDPRGTSGYIIRLRRVDDPRCQAAPPAPACRCDVPGCVTP
jgi:hypothetical protein